MRTSRLRGFLSALLIAGVWQAAYVLTWPLNHSAGDAPNYIIMLLGRESNLTHASGYTFIVGEIMRALGIEMPGSLVGQTPSFLLHLQMTQHVCHFFLSAITMVLLARALGAKVAILAFLLAILSPFLLSMTSTSQPEWLQGDLIILSIAIAANAFRAITIRLKLFLYPVSAVVLALSFLVKYNSLPFAFVVIALIALDRLPLRRRALLAGLCALAAFTVTQAYIGLFHQPTSQTRTLQFNQAWVLLTSLQKKFGNHALESDTLGLSIQRWRALVRRIPPEYHHARAFRNLADIAPARDSIIQREAFAEIMSATREEVASIVARAALPEGFSLGLSAIPLMHYIGLQQSDQLGTAAFKEWVLSNKFTFFRRVSSDLTDLKFARKARPLAPTFTEPLGLTPGEHLVWGFRRWVNPCPCNYSASYWSWNAVMWDPGVEFFRRVHIAYASLLPERFLYAVFAICLLLPCRYSGFTGEVRSILAALVLGVAAFLVATNIVLNVRDKEIAAIWPLLMLIWAIALAQLAKFIVWCLGIFRAKFRATYMASAVST